VNHSEGFKESWAEEVAEEEQMKESHGEVWGEKTLDCY
jgi:hypothetical protein